jgi:hypothetical protein
MAKNGGDDAGESIDQDGHPRRAVAWVNGAKGGRQAAIEASDEGSREVAER